MEYNAANRMDAAYEGGSLRMRYRYDHLGERILREPADGKAVHTLSHEAGHWLGDYASDGSPLQQAVWMDDYPVALLSQPSNGIPALAYIQPDHLGSPRVLLDSERDVPLRRWPLVKDAFGAHSVEQDVDGDGVALNFNLRFPGQQYTAATGLYYNYQRDLDADTGRYVQSDPIGLLGGVSTYGYVAGNPVTWSDPIGLVVNVCRDPAFNGNLGPAKHYWITTDTQSAGMGTAAAGANAGNQYDSLGARVQTVNHSDRPNNGDRECKEAKGADESKVNKLITPGRDLGIFVLASTTAKPLCGACCNSHMASSRSWASRCRFRTHTCRTRTSEYATDCVVGRVGRCAGRSALGAHPPATHLRTGLRS